GIATEVGGKTSHFGIFAAALGLPAVGGVRDLTSQVNTGDPMIVDGINGELIIHPEPEILEKYKKKQINYRRYEEKLLEDIDRPAETLDGVRIKLLANIESADEVKVLRKFGAEGVGLYRTEFLYMGGGFEPDETELYENFKKVAREMDPMPVVIRTLDIGMDKHPGSTNLNDESNPALGMRGIRFSLAETRPFKAQLRAILRASLYGDVRILYPMISDTDEILRANHLLEQTKEELRAQEVPFNEDVRVGAMIETPAAAICVDTLLQEVDFISIGTNDLIQYILAVDRINESVAHLYQPFHPSVLRILKTILSAAQRVGKPVSICGELGGDPMATMLLLGLGTLTELSMEPHALPKVKKIIRRITIEESRQIADHVLSLSSTEAINRFITTEMRSRFPSDFDRGVTFEEKLKPAGRNSS
ncbi:MAG: phosphoenolpyruvate--protein phosphotransferase, partial [Nitrospinaceae bacterium]|nr:phosphoenolpyruvate--protein phosphotransferase [Nitrospinaceae bacterium]NIR56020.1 phosphoenolpyruvate--protein phosphotransferase [Nitrospinaceae bacterium]NIS86464.1 phosphoenolpyruvate--protein phosphotransferase [Nitrospinaceae bacterium]NIT83299.1 phosphoenolpyruvate--protein phosphotransferase [Nitrospinaceae bacterium]NIU45509.1 phosphoenolpyruvate--protein phosphotransferase [Nitrospinaceae bacterium]